MGDAATLVELPGALLNLGEHVEVIEDILERALFRKAIEEIPNRFLGLQRSLLRGSVLDHRQDSLSGNTTPIEPAQAMRNNELAVELRPALGWEKRL